MSFTVALSNVLLTLFYMLPGYAACKIKKVDKEHLSSLSGVLVYVCSPCMILSSFLSMDFSVEQLKKMGIFFVLTLALQGLFIGVLYLLLKKRYTDSRCRLLTVGSVMGNVGFFGLPVIRALFPTHAEVLCYSSIYAVTMNVLAFTVGIFCLTGKKEDMRPRAVLLNPSSLTFVLAALPLYILGGRNFLPALLLDGVDLLGKMTTPLCMLILGVRLATVSFSKLFVRPAVYLISAMKLLGFPLFILGVTWLLPLDDVMRASIVILSATPCASILFNLAEIHHSEEELSANCVLVSTLLCFLTIPLFTLLMG